MNANLEAKQAIVEEIKEKIQKAKTVVFVDYRGITVEADTKMRAEIRKSGSEYKVYKNRLVVRALNELGFEGCEKYLEGTFNKKKNTVFDYKVYCLCSDGDLMEGISYEAASLAGTLGLDNLIVL